LCRCEGFRLRCAEDVCLSDLLLPLARASSSTSFGLTTLRRRSLSSVFHRELAHFGI
jgi:hypothetical protein